MLFFKLDSNGKVSQVSTQIPEGERTNPKSWIARHEMKQFDDAHRIAKEATEVTGELYVGIDNGPSVWPRYDVMKAPKVGEAVSYGFNGDYYPDGEIVHVTAGTLRQIKTSTGATYYRRKQSGGWTKKGGTWSLVMGTHNDKNPEF